MMERQDPSIAKRDELDLFQLLSLLWKRKALIISCGLAAAIAGFTVGLLSTKVYHAESIIAPKTAPGASQGPSLISQLGGFGSAVGSSLGIGNANVDRMELMVRSHDLAGYVIRDNPIMPRLFPKRWDDKGKKWKSGNPPQAKEGVDELRSNLLSVRSDPKKGILVVGIDTYDPTFASEMVGYYLAALKKAIQENVKADADSNRKFLELQLTTTTDPLLREKIHQLVGLEIEKTMLVSSRSFDILESAMVPTFPAYPHKRKMAMISFLLGAVAACLWVIGQRAIAGNRT